MTVMFTRSYNSCHFTCKIHFCNFQNGAKEKLFVHGFDFTAFIFRHLHLDIMHLVNDYDITTLTSADRQLLANIFTYQMDDFVEKTSALVIVQHHSLAPLTKRHYKTHVKYYRDKTIKLKFSFFI